MSTTARTNRPTEPLTGARIRIGVMGSARGDISDAALDKCRRLGEAIADHDCWLITGACPGYPHAAVLGAAEKGGQIIGISPARDLKEHVEMYLSPFEPYDVLIFTGLGPMGRELVNIRTSDIVVIVGGNSGTLGEFAIAYEEGKLIGVLRGSGGIADVTPDLVRNMGKETGAQVVYEEDPDVLIDRLLKRYGSTEYTPPCMPTPEAVTETQLVTAAESCADTGKERVGPFHPHI